jgi:nucleoid-associated protein YgaU
MGKDNVKNFLKMVRKYQVHLKFILLGVLIFVASALISYRVYRNQQMMAIPSITNDVRIEDLTRTNAGSPAAQVATPSAQVKNPVGFTSTVPNSLGKVTHLVQKGETLWILAEKYYGNGALFPKIQYANKIKGTHLMAGTIVTIPDQNYVVPKMTMKSTVKYKATKTTTKAYVVQKGDSLWKISKTEYQTGHKWPRIYRTNQKTIGSNPHLIYPKTKLLIPKK